MIGDLEGYVERSSTILVFCSRGYFNSKNCMRELHAAVTMCKPIIALVDPDESRGGLSLEQLKASLIEADDLYAKWSGQLYQTQAIIMRPFNSCLALPFHKPP